jgi:hypothetical protein
MKISVERGVVMWDDSVYNKAVPYLLSPNVTDEYTATWDDMINWCKTSFGPEGELECAASSTWYYSGGCFYFRDESDLTMFVLRWS